MYSIARFENLTGEEAFDSVLEQALERELMSSLFLNVVPRERIDDVLRLMRKPAGAPIDEALNMARGGMNSNLKLLLLSRHLRAPMGFLLHRK